MLKTKVYTERCDNVDMLPTRAKVSIHIYIFLFGFSSDTEIVLKGKRTTTIMSLPIAVSRWEI